MQCKHIPEVKRIANVGITKISINPLYLTQNKL